MAEHDCFAICFFFRRKNPSLKETRVVINNLINQYTDLLINKLGCIGVG